MHDRQLQLEIAASLWDYPNESERILSEISLNNFDEPFRSAIGKIFENRNKEPETLILLLRDIPKLPLKELLDIKANTSLIFLDTVTSKYKHLLEKEKVISIANNELSTLALYETLKEESENYLNAYNSNSLVPYTEELTTVFENLQHDIESDKNNNLKSTRFPKLNDITGGFNTSNVIGIAGIFKSGKTSFSLSLLIDYIKQNIPVCFFSLELTKDELVKKIISYETGINYAALRSPKLLTDAERLTLARYYNNAKKEQRKLFVISDSLSIYEIKSRMRSLRSSGVNTFFIDYIGYIKSDANFDSRERELTFYSNYLKRTAKELDITVFLLAQLNRSGKIDPSSINLAESVGLARDCDFLFTISEASVYNSKITKQFGDVDLENKFVLKLDSSRHSEQGKMILLEFTSKGMQQAEIFGIKSNEHYQNFYEREAAI